MRENPKTFQGAVQSALAEQNLRKRFQLRTVDSQSSKSRTEGPMEVDHTRPQKKCFLCSKTGHLAKHCRSRIINAVEQVRNSNKGEVECWECGQKGHMKKNCKKKGGSIKFWQYSTPPNLQKLENSNHVEAYGECTVHYMPIFKIELAGNPNSCIIKINKQKFRALLDSGSEVSLIHTRCINL